MNLKNKGILMFVEDYYEDLELWYPKLRLIEAGARVVVAGPEKDKVYKGKHGYPCSAGRSIEEIRAAEFDSLVICGGFAPDKLRRVAKVIELTQDIFRAGKVVAHICHGGWVPISAGIMRGMRCTSSIAIRDDITNAGGTWVDEPVVVHRNMISSRGPDDLPVFCSSIIQVMSEAPVHA
jgi:protease I